MERKYTNGPWTIERSKSGIIKSIGPIETDEYAGSSWIDISESDARLIAAAPELLEALIDCRRALEIGGYSQELAIVDYSITKALGETE